MRDVLTRYIYYTQITQTMQDFFDDFQKFPTKKNNDVTNKPALRRDGRNMVQ